MKMATPGTIPAQFVPPRLAPIEQAAIAKAVDDLRHTQPWSYYSTILIEDFAQVTSQVLSFWQGTKGIAGPLNGYAMTNLVQPGQIPEAFRIYSIAVRVAISLYDDPRMFELLTNFSAIEMKVGSDEMAVGPLTNFPAGGGVTGMIELGPQAAPIWAQPPAPGPVPPGGPPAPVPPVPPVSGGQPLTDPHGWPIQATPATPAPGYPVPGMPGYVYSQQCKPIYMMPASATPYNVLTNGAPHRSNMYVLGKNPILIKKGANISTDLHITQAALRELQQLRRPLAPGITIQLRLEGRRARAAGYGTGG
jgi:hypothetical protein